MGGKAAGSARLAHHAQAMLGGKGTGRVDLALALAAAAVAVALAVAHMIQAQFFLLGSSPFKSLHVNMSAVLVFLLAALRTDPTAHVRRGVLLAFAIAAAVPLVYIHLEHDAIIRDRTLFPNDADRWIALLMLATVFTAAWLEWGLIVPALATAGLVYGHLGNHLPAGLFYHAGISLDRLLAYTSIPSFGGMLGSLTEESARTIFMFMLFAGALTATGGTSLIMKVSLAAVGHLRAGPAQVAVVSSALFGMISGSTVANVAAQGPYTIPTMRRVGFSAEFAGAIEAVSSTGGQVTPPVLGLTAFLIVGLTGIPYYDIMIATLFPALILYLFMMVNIHIEAVRRGIGGMADQTLGDGSELDRMSVKRALGEHAHVLAATLLLFWLLSIDMPTGLAALYPTLLIIAGELVKQLAKGRSAPLSAFRAWAGIAVRALVDGARSGAQVAIVVAVINVLVEMFVVTGFGQKMSHVMLAISDGSLWLLLLVSAATCIVLGCGVPTSAAYILVALLGAPALIKLDVPVLAAHLFVFFYANLSAITPPVALAALVAANISGGSYLRTAVICVWLGLPCFVLPFLFVLHPEIIGIGAGPHVQIGVAALALVSVLCATFVLQGYMLGPLSWLERVLLVPAILALLMPGWLLPVAAYGLVAGVALVQWLGPAREVAVVADPGAARSRPVDRIGRWLADRAGRGQTVD